MFAKLFQLLFKRKPSAAAEAPQAEPQVTTPTEPVQTLPDSATPEELCELTDGMTHEELRVQLSKLYRRHNRAASSLNPELREQAERMLDAIVDVRHRYLDLDSEDA